MLTKLNLELATGDSFLFISQSFKMYRLVYPPESTDLQTVHMIDEIVIESSDFYQYVSELCGKLFLAGILLFKKTITIKFAKIVDIHIE